MHVEHARHIATALMADHGLTRWSFRFDRAVRRAGQTNFTTRTISLSKPLTELCDEDQVLDTIRHEIAHALAGPRHGHDQTWRKIASELGATPRARRHFPQVPGRYVAVCSAGHTHYRYRKPRAQVSCGRCSRTYSENHRLNFVDMLSLIHI